MHGGTDGLLTIGRNCRQLPVSKHRHRCSGKIIVLTGLCRSRALRLLLRRCQMPFVAMNSSAIERRLDSVRERGVISEAH